MNQRAHTTRHSGPAKTKAKERLASKFGMERKPFFLSTSHTSSGKLIKAGKHGLPFSQKYLPTSVQEVIRSSGEELHPTTRAYMELRYGHDFSQVRVHTNKRAAESASAVNARAYTVGCNIVFGEGEYAPHTINGRHLLAHECAHVIQQQRGGASPPALHLGSTLEQAAVHASSALMNDEGPVHVAGASRPVLARVPLSLEQSLHPASLSVEQLEREIGEIEGWLFTSPSSPENERLRTTLRNLRNELENRQVPERSSTAPARRPATRRASSSRARSARGTRSAASSRESTEARQLIGQAEVLDQVAPIAGNYGTYGVRNQGRTIRITQTALDQARREFRGQLSNGIRRVDSRIYGGRAGHRSLSRLREEQFIVSRISDVIGGVSFPPLSIWNIPHRHLRTAQAALRGTRFRPTTTALIDADATSAQAYRRYRNYREGTIRGAERTVTGLEITRDVSFATAGIMATVATGGTAGAFIATGITTTGRIAQQGMEMHLGLRDRIDWAGITFDALVGLVTSRLGGRLGNSIASRLVRNPQFATLGQRVSSRLISNLIAGRAASTMHLTARMLFDNLRGAGRPLTVEQFINQLAVHLTDPRSAFMDILMGEVGRRFAAGAPPRARSTLEGQRTEQPSTPLQLPPGPPTRVPPSRQLPPGPPTRVPPSRQLPPGPPSSLPPSRQLPPRLAARVTTGIEQQGTRPAPGTRTTSRAQYRRYRGTQRAGQSVTRSDRPLPGTYHHGPLAGQPRMGHPTRHRASKTNRQLRDRALSQNIRASTRFASDRVQLRVMHTLRRQAVSSSTGRTNGSYTLADGSRLQVRGRTGNTPTVGERLILGNRSFCNLTTGKGYWGLNAPSGHVPGTPTGRLNRGRIVLEMTGHDLRGSPIYEIVTSHPE